MEVKSLYSTPIWTSNFPTFEKDKDLLIKIIQNNIQENQILKDIHRCEEFSSLFEYICDITHYISDQFGFSKRKIAISSSFINSNIYDNHPNNTKIVNKNIFSGVFCIKKSNNLNHLYISNPGLNKMWLGLNLVENKNELNSENVKIDLSEGGIAIWPSYVPHFFKNDDIENENILLSFGIMVLPENGSLL